MTLPDRDSLATYGGAKSNYSEPVDPTTDEDADARNKYAANVAMMTHLIARGVRSFLGASTSGSGAADPLSGLVHDSVWGDSSSVKPSVTLVATGTYDVIWPSTVTDELGEDHTLSIRRAVAQVESSDGTLRLAHPKVTAAQKVRVYTYAAPSLTVTPQLHNLVGEVISVWIY